MVKDKHILTFCVLIFFFFFFFFFFLFLTQVSDTEEMEECREMQNRLACYGIDVKPETLER